ADELARDRAADDLVDELEAAAARERLDLDVGHGVLAVTAGLLHVAALGLSAGLDGLPVRDLRGMMGGLDAELALHALHRHVEVGLAAAVAHGLVRRLGALSRDRG